ncbi:glycosyltransferase [Rhizobium sp. PAMB 3174]
MSKLKITIVTPAYKSAETIEETINSVIFQAYANKEYIIVDGHGDHTGEILKSYDSHIDWWCSEPDDGQYAAIKKGFSKATGDVFFWLNADDKLLPGALEVVADIFESHPKIEWLSSLAPGHYDSKGYYQGHGNIPGFSKEAFLDGYFLPEDGRRGKWIQQESTFFRRSLWEKNADSFGELRLAGDFALWCEFYKSTDLYGVTYPLSGFRHRSGQRSDSMETYLREGKVALTALREHEGYQPGRCKNAFRSFLTRIPILKRKLRGKFGYSGKKISRTRAKYEDASWSNENYYWFP